MKQFYKLGENNYPIISTIKVEDDMIEYEVGAEPQELLDAMKAQEIIDAELKAKQARDEALNSITVTTSMGNIFDGRDKDRARMNEVIQASSILGVTETQWKLHDNTVATITLDELKEALALSIQAASAIIVGS